MKKDKEEEEGEEVGIRMMMVGVMMMMIRTISCSGVVRGGERLGTLGM